MTRAERLARHRARDPHCTCNDCIAHHASLDDEHDIIDHRPGRYYVTVRDHGQHGYLLGPYDTHQEALENVERGKRLAEKADSRAFWYAFGTARIQDDAATVASVFGR